ncbi:hypothetical protein GGD89_002707 [Roseospira visakhapatnamensis]|uniref:Uncharacterized protein n=1 Tax=Roseospira visakhapatnamensis TaxID=390880 RepID=A0A7W6WB18_9PROT|nr:hypothetical protein [Roseospira visakhapatnamensis]
MSDGSRAVRGTPQTSAPAAWSRPEGERDLEGSGPNDRAAVVGH